MADLRTLAEAARERPHEPNMSRFQDAAHPQAILDLLDERDRERAARKKLARILERAWEHINDLKRQYRVLDAVLAEGEADA